MRVYLDLVILLNFLVDWLLLLGVNRLVGYPPGLKRTGAAALVGGAYAGACIIPGFQFLGNILWRAVSLGTMSVIAFGLRRSSIRRGALFFFLTMALGGIAMGSSSRSFLSIVSAAAGVLLLCIVGFRGNAAGQKLLPAELTLNGKHLRLLALHDTGNTLRDPVTGQQVMVVGADIAHALSGLTPEELREPVKTMTDRKVPGLRLIPYQVVGRSQGMLLAMQIKDVKIGSWQGSCMVAFAPEPFEKGKGYQMLAGGLL